MRGRWKKPVAEGKTQETEQEFRGSRSFKEEKHRPPSLQQCVKGQGCRFQASRSYSAVSNPLRPHRLWPTRLLCPWDFPGKNTGVMLPTSGDLPHLGIQPVCPASPALQADSLPLNLVGRWFHAWNGDNIHFHVNGRKPQRVRKGTGTCKFAFNSLYVLRLCVKLGHFLFLRRCVFSEMNLFLRSPLSFNLYL